MDFLFTKVAQAAIFPKEDTGISILDADEHRLPGY